MEIVLRCSSCDASYDGVVPRWQCHCGGYLDLSHDVIINRQEILSGPNNIWRYRNCLPLDPDASIITLGEGMTPLLNIKGFFGKAKIKADYLMPTGSYKDRGSALMLSQLKAWGVEKIIEDSSGNAGASVAAYSSVAKIDADVYIPAYTSAGKALQIGLYGANLIKVQGTREATTQAALEAAVSTFYASHNWNPWFVHGVKTLAYELWEQLGFQAPESVIVPVGNGSLVLGLAQGFSELLFKGEIKKLPKIYAVQTAACDPLTRAFDQGLDTAVPVIKEETVAEGIASAEPVKARGILQAVRRSGGSIISVEEAEILKSLKELIKLGFYVEPTSAVVAAALLQLRRKGIISAEAQPVLELTGSGLKATDKLLEYFKF